MKIHCLGSIGFHCSEQGHTPCYMIPELGVVFDAGSGFFRVTPLIQTEEIHVFISHAHLDHICGIMSTLEICGKTKCKKIFVYGDQDVINSVKAVMSPPIFPIEVNMEYKVILNDTISLSNGAKITSFQVNHCGECLGFRLEHPRCSVAYVTDTTSHSESKYIDQCKNVGLLIHECYCSKAECNWAPKIGHTCTKCFAEFVEKVQPKAIIITHHNPNEGSEKIKKELDELHPGCLFAYDNFVYDYDETA